MNEISWNTLCISFVVKNNRKIYKWCLYAKLMELSWLKHVVTKQFIIDNWFYPDFFNFIKMNFSICWGSIWTIPEKIQFKIKYLRQSNAFGHLGRNADKKRNWTFWLQGKAIFPFKTDVENTYEIEVILSDSIARIWSYFKF